MKDKRFPVRLNKDGSLSKELLDILNNVLFNAMRDSFLGEIKFHFDGQGQIVKAEKREILK